MTAIDQGLAEMRSNKPGTTGDGDYLLRLYSRNLDIRSLSFDHLRAATRLPLSRKNPCDSPHNHSNFGEIPSEDRVDVHAPVWRVTRAADISNNFPVFFVVSSPLIPAREGDSERSAAADLEREA